MNPTAILVTFVLATFLVGGAWAQATVQTELVIEELEPEPGWGPGTLSRNVEVALCFDQGGVNLAGGSFIVEIEATTDVDWANVTHPESIEITPPGGPSEEGCTNPVSFTLEVTAPDGVQPNETFEVQIRLSAEAETDESTGQPTTGTYETPSDASASFSVVTVPGPGGEPENGNGESEDDDGAEDNDTPGLALGVLLLGLSTMIAASRRKA